MKSEKFRDMLYDALIEDDAICELVRDIARDEPTAKSSEPYLTQIERAVLWAVERGGVVMVVDRLPGFMDPIAAYVVRETATVHIRSTNSGTVTIYDPRAEDASDARAIVQRARPQK